MIAPDVSTLVIEAGNSACIVRVSSHWWAPTLVGQETAGCVPPQLGAMQRWMPCLQVCPADSGFSQVPRLKNMQAFCPLTVRQQPDKGEGSCFSPLPLPLFFPFPLPLPWLLIGATYGALALATAAAACFSSFLFFLDKTGTVCSWRSLSLICTVTGVVAADLLIKGSK